MSPPAKRQRMTVTQTYRLAHTARGKLSTEASRGEYDLRVLVGHANMLDNIMIELAEAEKEQEVTYQTNSVRFAPVTISAEELEIPEESDSDSEEDEDDDPYEDSKDYSDYEDEVGHVEIVSKRTSPRSSMVALAEDLIMEDEKDDEYEDFDYDNADLGLVRTQSRTELPHHEHGVPELVHDSDDSDDESSTSPPLSPGYASIIVKDFAVKAQSSPATPADALNENGFWIPERQQAMVAAC
jgi:hypothetical protein